MKVNIGPYINWFGPYQLAEKIIFWADGEDNYWSDKQQQLGDWLATDKDGNDTWLTKLLQWIHSFKKRKVYVHIDNFDVWNLDSTLSLIIGPLFQRLKEKKVSYAFVDNEDAPEHLRDADISPGEGEWGGNARKRYEWLLNEMIWVFTTDHEEAEFNLSKTDMEAYRNRVENAYRLFGKYYSSFWD